MKFGLSSDTRPLLPYTQILFEKITKAGISWKKVFKGSTQFLAFLQGFIDSFLTDFGRGHSY